MEFKSNWQGRCPFCDSENLMYGTVEFEGDCIYFPWTCYDCEHEGKEWYNIDFIGHDVYHENRYHILEGVRMRDDDNENEQR